MAEVMVKIKHEDLLQKWIVIFLRFTFPFWGIAAPGAFIVLTVIWACMIYQAMLGNLDNLSSSSSQILSMLSYTFAFLAVPCGALVAMRALSKNSLVLEKRGIIFPIESMHFRLKRFLPWARVRKITVLPDEPNLDWKKKNLVFFLDDAKNDRLDLKYYSAAELEQLLVAMETWAKQAFIDPSVSDLQASLRRKQNESIGMSYTDMWEDELRRRYNPTAYMPLDPGIVLREGRLKVIRQLATGGLSAVYLTQFEDQKLAVLKEAVLPEDAIESVRAKASELFSREAQLLTKINHTNIVKVYDFFAEGGRNYLLMEHVPGQDLRQFIKQNGPQRENIVLDWAIQIAGILKHLHELDPPIIHRDLTPDNLVLKEDGNLVLIDFGAANEYISKGTGTFVGKQCFIAPEQFRGKAVLQSDIYAFGCTIFYLLTGKEPEALDTSSPAKHNENVSAELNEFVESCTQLELRDRYQSAAQLIPVLRKIAASHFGAV